MCSGDSPHFRTRRQHPETKYIWYLLIVLGIGILVAEHFGFSLVGQYERGAIYLIRQFIDPIWVWAFGIPCPIH